MNYNRKMFTAAWAVLVFVFMMGGVPCASAQEVDDDMYDPYSVYDDESQFEDEEDNSDMYRLVAVEVDTVPYEHNMGGQVVKIDTIDYLSDQKQYYFFGVNAGLSYSMSENTRFSTFTSLNRPSFNLQVGKFFYPQFGIRASLSYLQQMGAINWELGELMTSRGENQNYGFKMACAFLDGMFNFHNVLWKYDEKRVFNLIGYLGLGYMQTFGFDKSQTDLMANKYGYVIDTKSQGYFAGHVGLIALWKLGEKFDVNFDVSFNGTDDAYNGKRFQRVYDTYVNVMLGVNYRIRDISTKRRLRYSHYVDKNVHQITKRTVYEIDDPVGEQVSIHEDVRYNEMLQTTVSFYIDKTFITEAQRRNVKSVAQFLKNHPDMNVVVTGYADVQTAYPSYNLMLSRKRAQAVYDMLVKEFSIDPKRLSMEYKGDQEQPFQLVNEWNRAVVFRIMPRKE